MGEIGGYEATIERLIGRILETFAAHPEAAKLTDAWSLFSVPGFHCRDLDVSMGQAMVALAEAKRRWRPDTACGRCGHRSDCHVPRGGANESEHCRAMGGCSCPGFTAESA
jgi:hypothetical protein